MNTQTVWQWVPHAPVWAGQRAGHVCRRCGVAAEGRAIHDPDYGVSRGEFVDAEVKP